MLLDLRPDQLQIVQTILRKHVPQCEVWAFGSRAKWTAKDYSDLDLCIVSDQPLSFKILGALNEAFAESELPWKVDVVDWATTSDSFRKIIERDKVVVQSKKNINRDLPNSSKKSEEEMAGWRPGTIGDCVVLQSGGTPSKSRSDFWGGYIPWVSAKDMKSFWIDNTEDLLTEAGAEAATRLAPVGTTLILVRGMTLHNDIPICRVRKPAAFNQDVKAAVPKFGVDPEFVPCLLRGNRERLLNIVDSAGHGTGRLNTDTLLSLPVPIPPPPEQRAIAFVLGSIDDKIELDASQCGILEEMARTLFQSWFVDFDPVRAKAKGHPPFGLDANTAALSPDSFEDSDLGEIPAGWSSTTLADIVVERTGKVGSGNGHVILSAVASGELKHSDEHFTKQVYSQDTSKYKRVEQWDYAYNPSRINIGSIGMLEEPIVGAVSPVYTVLRPAQGYEWFLRFFLDLPQTKAVINQFCSGSVRQSLSFKDFAAIPVVLPPKEIAEAFSRRWQELNALRQQLDAQSRQLAEVRDTLLPKLMSGELRVPESLMA